MTTTSLTATWDASPFSSSIVGSSDDLELTAERPHEAHLELVRLHRAEEADTPEVDADHGDARAEGRAEGAEHRPVASEYDDELGVGWVAVRLQAVARGLLRPHDEVDAGVPGDPQEPVHAVADLAGPPVRDERGPRHGRRAAYPTAASIRRSSSSGSEGVSLAIRWTTNSRFPFGPGWPESTTPATRAPHEAADAQNARSTRRCTSGSRTTPFGASARPASNWGLTRTSASHRGVASATAGGRTRVAEMNETSQTISSGAVRQRVQMAGVHALEDRDAAVRAEPGMQLAVPDVERDHARGPALEQAVGEAARGGADVQAVPARRVDPERVERVRQLLAAARDEARRALDLQSRRVVDLLSRLVVARHEARHDEGLRLRPALGEPSLHEQDVESLPGHDVPS